MLVVVDSANGKTDAIPITQVTQLCIIEAFKKVFDGRYLRHLRTCKWMEAKNLQERH